MGKYYNIFPKQSNIFNLQISRWHLQAHSIHLIYGILQALISSWVSVPPLKLLSRFWPQLQRSDNGGIYQIIDLPLILLVLEPILREITPELPFLVDGLKVVILWCLNTTSRHVVDPISTSLALFHGQ